MIQGERVFLRPIEIEDLPLIARWRNDADVAKYTWPGVPYPVPLAKQQEWFDDLQKDTSQKALLICLTGSGKPIGTVRVSDIMPRSQSANLSISIGEKAYWGQGYGTEALHLVLRYSFRILNLRRIQLEVYEYNERAIRAYEKVGFVKEGKVRRSIFKDGRYFDEYFMAIFQEDYLAKHPERVRG